MNFALPAAFWWTLLALPIIGFYLLRVRRRRIQTSTTMFWDQIYDEAPPRSIWDLLKHLLSLVAQLFLLALLVLACTDPVFSWQTLSARRLVLILDPSASMQVREPGKSSRWEEACQLAERTIDGMRFPDEMAILVAGQHPRVVSGFTGHLPTLKSAIHGLSPTDEPTDLLPAVELGTRLLAEHPHGEVIAISDGCTADWTALKERPLVQRLTVGSPLKNVGLTQFQVRRSQIDPLGYEVLLAVRNASDSAVSLRVELRLDGIPVDIIPIQMGPNENWRRSLEKTSLKGGTLTAELTRFMDGDNPFPDGLDLDNRASAIIPGREVQPVLLVTPGNLFLQKAFESNPLVRLTVIQEAPASWPESGVIVLHRQIPLQLPPGNVWVIDPENGCDAFEAGGILENPIITNQNATSPLMLHVKLDNVVMPQARKLSFTTSPEILAGTFTNDAVYAEVKRNQDKLLVLTTNLDEGDLTLRTAFPILVTNALAWFAGTSGEIHPALSTGEVAAVPPPVSQPAPVNWQLRRPDGKTVPVRLPVGTSSGTTSGVASDNSGWKVGPFDQVGLWQLESISDESPAELTEELTVIQTFACNLANATETDLRPPEPTEVTGNLKVTQASWLSYPLWSLFVLLALILITVEWSLYQRRVIR